MPRANSQDKILEGGKETDIVIPFVITSCSIRILTKDLPQYYGRNGRWEELSERLFYLSI